MTDVTDNAAKPLDVGSGRVCASFSAASAAWLSLGMPHPVHGFVELSDMPAFPDAGRSDPAATRRYRVAMTLEEHAFLCVEVDGGRPTLLADPSDPALPRWSGNGIAVRAWANPGSPIVSQEWTFEGGPQHQPKVVLNLRGAIDRPPLAEITELERPAPTHASTSQAVSDETVLFEAAALPAWAEVDIGGGSVRWKVSDGETIGTVTWPQHASDPLCLTISCRLAVNRDQGPAPRAGSSPAVVQGSSRPSLFGDPLVDRALAYIRGCTALATDRPAERVILTDHRILPLSWTRDAYWQALALLAADEPGDRERVAEHLRWLWCRCERPDGRWVRSHHADGRRKDRAFQADQQLYPLIELADYWRLTGELPGGIDWDDVVARAWRAAVDEIDASTGLMASTENAADDPAEAPFIAASQILLWYSAERLVEIIGAAPLELNGPAVRDIGASVRAAFDRHLSAGGGPWPYAIDAGGANVAYHDANDLPVALAPLFGFCAADDPGWRATVRFAFSPENPAWFDGPSAGLGSVHTPGPWTLGDAQAWIVGRITGDQAAARHALARLQRVAFADSMLPEAYSADGDGVRIRHWFAWPGAALAALRLLDEAGCLEERLAARRIA